MENRKERRGRPAAGVSEVVAKKELTYYEHPHIKVRDQGYKITYFYDISKNPNSPYKTEMTSARLKRDEKSIKIDKNKPYNNQPVVMIFKPSTRKNSKIKMKIWYNQNVDYIMSAESLPGIPNDAEILGIGVGEAMINNYKLKYNL
jgi:hypothetical protein